MPLTVNGFERLTYDEILENQIVRAKELFGDDIDTSESSTFGKMLRLFCLDAADNQELSELVYLSAFPATATGVSLDRLVPVVGLTRNPATYAEQEVEISGTADTVIPMGFLVSAGDIVFHTLETYTIGSDGTVTATVECNDAGTVGNVAVGSIDTIVNPMQGVDSVSHTATIKLAVDVETDYSLRNRFSQALTVVGSGTLDAIGGAILRVPTVESVYIEENSTDNTVGGLPPHSFQCYVLAPVTAKQAIAKAIFDKKPVGVQTVGDVTETVTDSGGGSHTIKFTWTTEVSIYVKCTITTTADFSAANLQEIKDNIVEKLAAYTNDQDVTATSLYAPIYVDGVTDVTALTISDDDITYVSDKIDIDYSEVARTIAANIEVTVS